MVWCNYEWAWGGSYKDYYKEQSLNGIAIQDFELQPIKFQGQSLDIETGLHYNRFRYYDSDVGMFISRDPIGLLGGNNVFQYAPNPIHWIDVLGLMPLANPINQGHHMVPHEVATALKLEPFNSQTNVPSMYFNDDQWEKGKGFNHSAMHGYNSIGSDTKPKVKPVQVVGKMSAEDWFNSLEKHYQNPSIQHIRGDLHIISSNGTKGSLIAKNVSPAQAWELTKKWGQNNCSNYAI